MATTMDGSTTQSPADLNAAAVAASVLARFRNLIVALAIGYSMIFVLSTLLVAYMRYNRNVAFRGDTDAARKIILPAFMPLLLVLSVVSFAFSAYFVATLVLSEIHVTASKVETELYYSGRLFVVILTMIYMYQKSVTTPALQRAVLITLALCTYNLPIVWYTSTNCSAAVAYYVPTFTRLPVPLLFVWAFVSPPARASRRTIREYCAFVFVYYALFVAYSELFYSNSIDLGFTLCFCNIFWGSLCPLVIWRVLRADTAHWRGLGQRACVLQSLFRQKHNINEHISSQGLHVLIEMHRKYIIDFAYLELRQKIGVGSSAVVFNGILHSKTPVAIKVYTPVELVDDVVAEFSHEAALCGALHHPNIVKFYGMCVCPPTICLVSELCQGSLEDVTRSLARRKFGPRRQQLLINLQYMIDATRAVAYLHSFSPAFVHRDIKPANFLVNAKCVVKLTDFGESRSLPRTLQSANAPASDSADYNSTSSRNALRMSSTGDVWTPMSTPTPALLPNAMTVCGTADYMAPEIIQGKAGLAQYGEAADVYALAITMWDILHPLKEKYSDANGNHFKIYESVLADKRPSISDTCHPEIMRILRDAWDTQPDRRPAAQHILARLEALQQEIASDAALVLAESIEKRVVVTKKGTVMDASISGQLLMQHMLELDFVETVEEASRLGNGFMSAGLLHHVRHLEPFSKTTELFFFDDAMIDAFGVGELRQLYHHAPYASASGAGASSVRPAELVHSSKFFLGDSYLSSTSMTAGERDRLSSTLSSHTMASQQTTQLLHASKTDSETCSCQKLGRGLGVVRAQRSRFRRNNKKWFAIVEESILTEKLLADEFDRTHETHSPVELSDLESAILHASDNDDEDDVDDRGANANVECASSAERTVERANGAARSKADRLWTSGRHQ